MDQDEFARLLADFAQRPLPALRGRHVYLWHGEQPELAALAPRALAVELDLYTLAGELPRTPYAEDEARRALHSALQAWLREYASENTQQIIIVTGNSLLARYHVALDTFFQAASETRLFILVVSPRETGYRLAHPLPPYVLLQASATLDYLRPRVGDSCMIGATS